MTPKRKPRRKVGRKPALHNPLSWSGDLEEGGILDVGPFPVTIYASEGFFRVIGRNIDYRIEAPKSLSLSFPVDISLFMEPK